MRRAYERNAERSGGRSNALGLVAHRDFRSGNLNPLLTFNLMSNGSSDTLTLTGTGTPLSFSGADKFVIGFASGTGSALKDNTYLLLSFTNPGSGDTSGLDTSNANNSFQAVGTGNLARTSGTFQWTKNSSGNITGLQYVLTNSEALAEPSVWAFLLTGSALQMLGASALRMRLIRRRRKHSM